MPFMALMVKFVLHFLDETGVIRVDEGRQHPGVWHVIEHTGMLNGDTVLWLARQCLQKKKITLTKTKTNNI